MAADAATTPSGSIVYGRGPDGTRTAVLTWAGINGAATGSWLAVPGGYYVETIYANPTATFGAATLVLQGSNEPITTTSPTVAVVESIAFVSVSLARLGLNPSLSFDAS